MARAPSKYNLLVAAHPDDETIFFGALLLSERRLPWHVICVTDANADGMGKMRKKQFENACKTLKVQRSSWLGFPDVFEKRLDVTKLTEILKGLPSPHQVFTHGIVGEYGHPHHQDVSFAVHSAFAGECPIYSSAYNAFPDLNFSLKPAQYKIKTEILSKIYGSETSRFMHLLPATSTEGFVRVSPKEVGALYRYYVEGKTPPRGSLDVYEWFWPHLKSRGDFTKTRIF